MAGRTRLDWLLMGLVAVWSIGIVGAELHVGPGGYATIQAAINAAAPGATIVVAAGTYVENLNITKSVTISGVGTDLVILQPAAAGYGIGVSGAESNVTIENITITAGNAVHFLVHVSGVQNFTIQNVKVVGAGKMVAPGGFPLGGIDLHAVSGAVIRNVEVENVSRNGVALTNSTEVTIEDIDVHDTGVSTGWAGVAIYATVAGSFSVAFAGTNTLANTPMGIYVEDWPGAIVNLAAPAGTLAFSGQSVAPLVKLGQGSTPNLETTALGLGLVSKVYAPESPTPPYNTGVAFYATVAEALVAAVIDPLQAPYTVVFDLGLDRFVVGPGMQIQRALNASQNGDTVFVKAGTYVTQGLISKGITLRGEPGTVIHDPAGSATIQVSADDVTVAGLTIVGYGRSEPSDPSGSTMYPIYVWGPFENIVIEGNTLRFYTQGGVYFYKVADSVIRGNTFEQETRTVWHKPAGAAPGYYVNVTRGGHGPVIWCGTNIQILDNTMAEVSSSGVWVYFSDGTKIEGNLILGGAHPDGTGDSGIHLQGSTETMIVGNTIGGLLAGEREAYTRGVAGAGVNTLGSPDTDILYNVIADNSVGIRILDSGGSGATTIIHFNSITGNAAYGVFVFGAYPTTPGWKSWHYDQYGPAANDVNAALNWWGDPEGPTHASNPTGAGDRVSDNVIYSPWLGTDPDGDPTQPGVQVTGPMLIIVAPVGPEPTGGYLNTAIAGANELPYADTIEVRHGTYDASEPITGPVTIISQEGSASHTTLTGPMSLKSGGILVGLPLRGFTIMGNVTVEELVDAASSRINWSNVYGTITNKGTGTFDARYNYWGTQVYAVIDARTIGDIAVDPYLPRNADDSYRDIEALFTAGVAGDLDRAIDQLWAMARLGQDVNTFVQYLGVAGAGALGGPPPGAQIGAGLAGTILEEEVAGGAAGLDYVVDGVVVVGDAIGGHFTLTDPVTGQPIAKAVVTLSLLGEDGKLAFWGAATYDPTTGEYVFSIDTSRLAPGTYQLIIQAVDGQSATLTIEILAA
ncbi:right-handed parallel beta-helix repeat-containing protein [Candidatus Bipolaricaulota bacterium]|nr:right-handed parallel beta-helix repeat-containing protein [Candidatus Bipolaricaulota bacterium]